MIRIFLLAALVMLSSMSVAGQPQGELIVDASQSLGAISPYVYGSNYGIYNAVPAELMPRAQALGLRFLRLGGGWSDERDLDAGFLDLFVGLSRQLGAEPAVTLRLFGSTPGKSAAIVRYANVDKGYQIRYWSIGNEPSLFASLFQTEYTTDDYNRDWRLHAEAILAVDPDLALIGPDVHQYTGIAETNPKDSRGRDWVQEFLKANGDLVDIVSIHRYPFPRSKANPRISIEDLRQNSSEWDDHIIPGLRRIIRETVGRDLPIAVTEVNSSWTSTIGGEASLDSHYNAIWFADVLGRLIRQQVVAVSYFDLQSRGGRTFGILAGYDVRPVYYTFQMYQKFGQELVASASTHPDVSVFAALRDDGVLTVLVVNRYIEPVTAPLKLIGFVPGGMAEVWLFDPDHRAEWIATQDIGDMITVPGQSVTVYLIPAA